jgi:hypothetical protein
MWVKDFCESNYQPKFSDSNYSHYRPKKNEIFIGFHYDVVATLVLYLTENHSSLIKSDAVELNDSMAVDEQGDVNRNDEFSG